MQDQNILTEDVHLNEVEDLRPELANTIKQFLFDVGLTPQQVRFDILQKPWELDEFTTSSCRVLLRLDQFDSDRNDFCHLRVFKAYRGMPHGIYYSTYIELDVDDTRAKLAILKIYQSLKKQNRAFSFVNEDFKEPYLVYDNIKVEISDFQSIVFRDLHSEDSERSFSTNEIEVMTDDHILALFDEIKNSNE